MPNNAMVFGAYFFFQSPIGGSRPPNAIVWQSAQEPRVGSRKSQANDYECRDQYSGGLKCATVAGSARYALFSEQQPQQQHRNCCEAEATEQLDKRPAAHRCCGNSSPRE